MRSQSGSIVSVKGKSENTENGFEKKRNYFNTSGLSSSEGYKTGSSRAVLEPVGQF